MYNVYHHQNIEYTIICRMHFSCNCSLVIQKKEFAKGKNKNKSSKRVEVNTNDNES